MILDSNSASGGYEIANSLKLEADNSENLYRNLNASTSTTKFTHSMWVKRTELTNAQLLYMRGVAGNEATLLRFSNESGYEHGLQIDIGASSTNARSVTTRKFRDTSAWYHIVLAVDTTQSTAANRRRLYVNGVEETVFGMSNLPSQNFAMEVSSAKHRYGAYNDTENYAPFSGYIAECHYIDGSQLDASSFGESDEDSGIWKPKQYTGSYGTGGYYLKFDNSSALGNNSAGDGTDFTLRNIAAADQATDIPTNNFCTMNTNFKTSSSIVVSEGQTKVTCGSGTGWLSNVGTVALTKGKWYWELASVTSVYQSFGIADASDSIIPQAAGGYYLGYGSNDTTLSVGMYMLNGSIYGNQDGGSGVGIAPSAIGDVYGVALDLDNLGFYIIRNGVSPSGSDPSSGSSLTGAVTWNDSIYSGYYYPAVSVFQGNGLEMNFGGYTSNPIASGASDANGYGNFEYAPPSGYYAICTKNLAEYG